jgi:hypothetical protein
VDHYDFGSERVGWLVGSKWGNSEKINTFRQAAHMDRDRIRGKENLLNYGLPQAVEKDNLKIPRIGAPYGLNKYLLVGWIGIYHKLRC